MPWHTMSWARFEVTAYTNLPLATPSETDLSQIIPLLRAIRQKLLRDLGRYSVVPKVTGGHVAVAVSQVACHWVCGVDGEGLAEHIEGFGHLGGGRGVERVLL